MDMIKINFTKTSADGIYSFSDALNLPSNHSYTEEEIEAMKQQRFDNWLNIIMNPPAPVEEVIVPDEPVIAP